MRYRTLLLLAVFLASLCFQPAAAAADLPTLADLVEGVSRISVAGYPGPVQANHPDWSVIAAGTPNKERPAGFVQARPFGKGRVIAIGYEGLLQSTDLSLSDNKRFLTNMLAWLTPPGRKQIAFAEGHSEWANLGAAQDLVRDADRLGYTVTGLSGALSRKSLSQTRVLVIGNAWGAFTAEEVSALTEFVQSGGGLLLAGLGWSWQQRSASPASTRKRVRPTRVRTSPC